jgi:hypothetical protein
MGISKPSITGFSGAPQLTGLKVDGITLVVDDAGDKVGINTSNPLGTLGVDGDLYFQPTGISTSHVYTAGSLDIRANNNIKLGTDGADSVRIGRTNTALAKVHIRSGSDTDLVVSNGKVGIGMDDPSDSLEVDGDIQLSPTAITTAHIKTAGSLDVRASGNIKIGTDGADSVRLGRVNTTAVKVHLRSGSDTDMVLFNSQLGLGTETPGTQLQLESTAPYMTLKNSTSENTAGGCESKIIFEDHADNSLGQIEVSHVGTGDDAKGQLTLSTNSNSGLAAAITIDEAQKVGVGTTDPGNILHVAGSDAYFTLQNTTAENGEGGAETRVLYVDHAGTALAMTEGSHSGTADDTKGKYIISTHTGSSLTTALTIDDTQTATFGGDVVIGGATPKLTIGDAGAEDTMLVFDGNAADFRIGIDDGTDTLEIGKGAAHGTTPVIKVDSATNLQLMHNSAVADGEYSGDIAMFTAGEDLTAGEVVYFKSDGKMWKSVATAAATSRCVAMCVATVSADAMGVFLMKGFARFNSEFPTWTVGGALYTPEAETSGKNVPEQAAPDTDGDFVQVIGFAVSGDAVYFDPDSTVVEVA